MRVIIADDEPIIRMDLKEILEKEGYTVAGEAADGFDVVEMCRKEQPDLVEDGETVVNMGKHSVLIMKPVREMQVDEYGKESSSN